jgi:hypothetical protein
MVYFQFLSGYRCFSKNRFLKYLYRYINIWYLELRVRLYALSSLRVDISSPDTVYILQQKGRYAFHSQITFHFPFSCFSLVKCKRQSVEEESTDALFFS